MIHVQVPSSIRMEDSDKLCGSGAEFPVWQHFKGCSNEVSRGSSNVFHVQSQTYNSSAEHSGSGMHTSLISNFKTTVGKKLLQKAGPFCPVLSTEQEEQMGSSEEGKVHAFRPLQPAWGKNWKCPGGALSKCCG